MGASSLESFGQIRKGVGEMRASHRLHTSLKGYFDDLKKEGCFSYNGEYPKSVERRLRSIHKQLNKIIKKELEK